MATKNAQHSKAAKDNAEFPGATGDHFGDQYFEKQGTEHSTHAPYEHCETRLPQEQDLRGDTVQKHSRGMGNKDQYQAGKTKLPGRRRKG